MAYSEQDFKNGLACGLTATLAPTIPGQRFTVTAQGSLRFRALSDLTILYGDGSEAETVSSGVYRTYSFPDELVHTVTFLGEQVRLTMLESDGLLTVETPFPPSGVTTLEGCFRNCRSLRSVPWDLLRNLPGVTNFTDCFYGCAALALELDERFFAFCPDAVTFDRCFYGCTSLRGHAPALWERSGVTGRYCFQDCRQLDNYDAIPNGTGNWRWEIGG